DGGRDRSTGGIAGRRLVSSAGGTWRCARNGPAGGCEVRRRAGAIQPMRLDVLRLLHERARAQPGRCNEKRPHTLREILPRDACGGRLPGAVAIRGRVYLDSAHAGRHRQDRSRGGEGDENFVAADVRRRTHKTWVNASATKPHETC